MGEKLILWPWRRAGKALGGDGSSRFTAIADAVSAGMGTPTNIAVWAAIVVAWFGLFMVNPHLQDTAFLPSWFTSNAFNFPLNTITTLAELFIGFLIAAAANRVEKRNWELHRQMARMLRHVEALTAAEKIELRADGDKLDRILLALKKLAEVDELTLKKLEADVAAGRLHAGGPR